MRRIDGSRAGSRIAAAAFAAQFVLMDVLTRGPRAYAHSAPASAGAVASVVAWWLVATAARRRAGRAAAAAIAGAALTLQAVVYRYYHAPLDAQVVASARHAWADVRPVVREALAPVALLALLAAAAEYAALSLVHARWARDGAARSSEPRAPVPATARRLRLASWGAAIALALIGHAAGPPDVRLVDSLRSLVARDATAGAKVSGVALGPIVSSRREPPDVLFLLTESVRAGDFADEETRALVPGRVDLAEMRAVASYTAVSVSALLTGRTQEGPRDALLAAPDLFDAARAVRGDGPRATVAYWSAQSASLFERKDPRGAVDSFVTVDDLVGHAVDDEDTVVDRGVDRLLAARAARDLATLAPPYLAMLHFAGTHAPYFFDEARAPFAPWRREVAWSKMAELRNAYRNAIAEQDVRVAACVRAFLAREAAGGRPYVIVFTSDHGEAFGEHGAIHHGQGLYDEQLHVPAWIAWGNGAIDDGEAASLRAYATRTTTHLDVLPTILDALGALDAIALAPHRAGLRGRSLLRAPAPLGAIPITNCTGMFPCPVSTWGMLGETHAVVAQPWDTDYRCFELRTFADRVPLDAPPCAALREAARRTYPTIPNGASL